jgi:hypothetical protein
VSETFASTDNLTITTENLKIYMSYNSFISQISCFKRSVALKIASGSSLVQRCSWSTLLPCQKLEIGSAICYLALHRDCGDVKVSKCISIKK